MPAALPCQERQGGPGQSPGTVDIHREHRIPILGLRSGQQRVAGDASRMDHRIDSAPARQRHSGRRGTRVVAGDVKCHGFDSGDQCWQWSLVPARQDSMTDPG